MALQGVRCQTISWPDAATSWVKNNITPLKTTTCHFYAVFVCFKPCIVCIRVCTLQHMQCAEFKLHYGFMKPCHITQVTADGNCSICFPVQMTEQRKQKQRIGLLGHPPHMNINPQQPAWWPLEAIFTCAWALLTVYHTLDRRMPKHAGLPYVCRSISDCILHQMLLK